MFLAKINCSLPSGFDPCHGCMCALLNVKLLFVFNFFFTFMSVMSHDTLVT